MSRVQMQKKRAREAQREDPRNVRRLRLFLSRGDAGSAWTVGIRYNAIYWYEVYCGCCNQIKDGGIVHAKVKNGVMEDLYRNAWKLPMHGPPIIKMREMRA